jgi:hypothetical protein
MALIGAVRAEHPDFIGGKGIMAKN